jgi:asparagine synthase (glutamine-hydrolysing)
MCGIAGIIARSGKKIDYQAALRTLSQTLQHRGRDGEGFFVVNENGRGTALAGDNTTENVLKSNLPFAPKNFIQNYNDSIKFGLLHRRLALVDTSEAGHQPLSYSDSEYWLTFNGEIYNYLEIKDLLEKKGCHFQTNTDTEVLLAAYKVWGKACLDYFNGMFTFVLYDSKNQILFGARDRFGVKPFYYTETADYWAFASEQKAFLKLPNFQTKINQGAAFDYFTMARIDTSEQGFFDGVKELLPAHCFIYNLKNHDFAISKYYELAYNSEYGHFDAKKAAEIAEKTQEMLLCSVNLRLQAAVEVGASLSGGIDSSALVGMARHLQPDIRRKVFTACAPGDTRDETTWAEKMVTKTASIWHKNTPDLEGLVTQIETVNYANDEPCTASNSYSHFEVMRSVQAANIKIVLDGQGADELFGGYPPHYNMATFSALRNGELADWQGNFFAENTSFANSKASLIFPIKTILNRSFSGFYNTALRKKSKEFQLLNDDFWQTNESRLSVLQNEYPLNLNALLHQQFTGNTLKILLHTSDRFAMWHSVESRVPFTDDHNLSEYIMSQSAAYKIKNGISKTILREATKPFLHPDIYNRKDKIGYASPEKIWLLQHATHWKTYLTDDMNEFYDVAYLRDNWTELIEKTAPNETHKIWRLLNFAIWRKVFNL